jgi:hypothetical protein
MACKWDTVLRYANADFDAKTDVTKRYIDWAIDNGFQVIDVNIPRIVAVEDVSARSIVFYRRKIDNGAARRRIHKIGRFRHTGHTNTGTSRIPLGKLY